MRRVFFLLALIIFCWPVFAQSYTISTVAGSDTLRDGGPATLSLLQRPDGIALDGAGNLYIADSEANRIRKVTPAGIITTFAGTGRPGFDGDGGAATQASLDTPVCVAADRNFLYICDNMNFRVRAVRFSTGVITTVAGNGQVRASGDGGPAVSGGLDPYAIHVDANGNLLIADWYNDRVRKVTVGDNKIQTIAGSGITGYSGDNGPATSATLFGPAGLTLDGAGNLYIADQLNFVIRKVDASGVITTFSGDGYPANYDGSAANASFMLPRTVLLDAPRNQLLVLSGSQVRTVSLPSGQTATIAGTGSIGFKGDGGPAINADFAWSNDLALAANGDVFIADTGNYRVRKITSGTVNTIAGADVKDGIAATSAYLNGPSAAAASTSGELVISDTFSQRVRRIGSDGMIHTIAGNGIRGSLSGRLYLPTGLAYDPQGNLFFTDSENHRILRVTPNGNVTTFAGSRKAYSGDGGQGGAAQFDRPNSLAFDGVGNLFIADRGNLRVRKVDASTGIISTVAGNGRPGAAGVNGPATQTQIDPLAVAADAGGNLYIADYTNNRVLKVAAATGIATIVAGTGAAGFSGDGGLAINARLFLPTSVAVDAAGVLYICDYGNAVLRRVRTNGVIETIAGSGNVVFDRDSGPALAVALAPFGVTVAPGGTIFIADAINNRIRKLTPQAAAALTIASGNNGKADPGAKLPISIRIADATGLPVAGITVAFTVASGSAVLSAPTASTGADGTATVTVTLGSTAGPVAITAAAPGLPAVTFTLTVNAVVTIPVPQIDPGGVAGAGLSSPAQRSVAVNGIASVFGKNFAPAGTAARVTGADLVNGRVPTLLAGVCVQVGTVRAPVFAVYPTQVNFQVPSAGAGAREIQIISGCGTSTEARSNTETITIQPAAPEFFYFKNNVDGCNPIAAVNAVTGAFLAAADLFPGGGFIAAKPDDIISLFGTSFGGTSPAIAPGEFPVSLAAVTGPVQLSFGGRTIPPVDVLYAGAAPGNPGLFQLNFRIPADMPDGDHEAILSIAGFATPRGPFVTVKR